MEMKTTFKVTARCKLLVENNDNETYNNKDIDLYLDQKDAMMMLFKFTPSVFKLSNGMDISMKFDNGPENKLIAMVLRDLNDDRYIVLNPQVIWTEVLEAYEEIRLFNKIQVLSSLSIPENEEEDEPTSSA